MEDETVCGMQRHVRLLRQRTFSLCLCRLDPLLALSVRSSALLLYVLLLPRGARRSARIVELRVWFECLS